MEANWREPSLDQCLGTANVRRLNSSKVRTARRFDVRTMRRCEPRRTVAGGVIARAARSIRAASARSSRPRTRCLPCRSRVCCSSPSAWPSAKWICVQGDGEPRATSDTRTRAGSTRPPAVHAERPSAAYRGHAELSRRRLSEREVRLRNFSLPKIERSVDEVWRIRKVLSPRM